MQGIKNLTQGPINRQLFNLAMPIMATSFIQMAYSLTDMAWVGRLGSEAVAAIGSVGILTWMSGSISLLNKVGSEVSVGQSIGAQNQEDARNFASHNITIALIISLCWGGLLFIFADPIMRIYELEEHITANAVQYLRIVSTGLPFIFLSAAFTGIYNAAGRSKVPFFISGTGLVLNIILDPPVHIRIRTGDKRCSLCDLDFGSERLSYFRLSVTPQGCFIGWFSILHPPEEKIYAQNFKAGIARSYFKHLVCFRKHVPLPHSF